MASFAIDHSRLKAATGGGGSIGRELCRQILARGPKSLVIIDHNEFNLFGIESELRQRAGYTWSGSLGVPLHFHLASVTDPVRMDQILNQHRPDTIYHAAAYKHVPIVEVNESEGAEVNVLGTHCMAESAARYGVAKFVLISTDKAVHPAGVMGATKRMGELLLQSLQARLDAAEDSGLRRTVFTTVRFGNVLESSGSVVPIFEEQIALGGPVTVTHPEPMRFFMTSVEAVQLILQAGEMARGGEIHALDMGAPFKVLDLARAMIRLSGASKSHAVSPSFKTAIEFIGLRAGEKLREESAIDTTAGRTHNPSIMTMRGGAVAWPEIHALLQRLERAIRLRDDRTVREILSEAVGEQLGHRADCGHVATPQSDHPSRLVS